MAKNATRVRKQDFITSIAVDLPIFGTAASKFVYHGAACTRRPAQDPCFLEDMRNNWLSFVRLRFGRV